MIVRWCVECSSLEFLRLSVPTRVTAIVAGVLGGRTEFFLIICSAGRGFIYGCDWCGMIE